MSEPLRVLILEDRIADAELMLHELRHAGYAPDWRRVQSELDYSAHLEPTLDIILADYTLPQFNALRALHLLQARGLDIPFIVVTGTVSEEAAVECMQQGAADYLLKDRLGRLGPAVERALQQKHLRDEKRQAEAALRESEERWQFALEGSGDGVWDWNLPTNQVSYSRQYKEMLGFAEDEFGNALEEWASRLHPDDVECLIGEQGKHFRGETPIMIVEYRMRCKDGSYKWILARGKIMEYAEDGAPVRMVGTHTDITDRRQADEEIKRLNRDLERRAKGLAALNKASQVMASTLDLDALLRLAMEQVKGLLDTEAASVLLCTPAAEKNGTPQVDPCPELIFAAATGLGSEKLVGMRLPAAAGIVGWAMREKQSARVTDAQSDPRFYNRVDRLTDMTTRSLLAVPLVLKGTVLGVVEAVNKNSGTFDEHDLEVLEALSSSTAIAIENARLYATEQQRAAALARALEQQRELDRLQREFIQNVSHELRTPLALIRGHAELLETGELGDLQTVQQQSASVISRRTRMLSKLVDDIIAVLTIESQELAREPLSLAQLVRTSLADFQAAAETAGLTLSAEIAPDLPLVSGDLVALHRMLDNLVSNALKFTSAKGYVTMRLFSDEDTVTLQVSDTGVGIPNDRLERIFDRFYQVDGSTTRHYGGVGLGLALVKEIVEAHGGQITVASQVGQGTTFTVSLPVGET